MARRTGRPSKFIPEVRQMLVRALAGGSTIGDACAMAGIGESTFYLWQAIGRAYGEGRSHPNMPRLVRDRDAYLEFLEEVKKAQASSRLSAVTVIQQTGRDRWVHRKTGTVRTSPPKPLTWVHEDTGEIIHDDPTFFAEDPEKWIKEWSGEAWEYQQGDWRSLAWYLERCDFANWGRRERVDVHEMDWRAEAIEGIKQGALTYETLQEEVGRDLAVELFKSAGVPVVYAGADQAGEGGQP